LAESLLGLRTIASSAGPLWRRCRTI